MLAKRLGQLLTWAADRLGFEKHVITRSWTNEPYLTRWILWGKRYPGRPERAIMLHRFHRSDADEPHDHPWVFVSIIVSGGYWEVTPDVGWKDGVGPLKRRWCGPDPLPACELDPLGPTGAGHRTCHADPAGPKDSGIGLLVSQRLPPVA